MKYVLTLVAIFAVGCARSNDQPVPVQPTTLVENAESRLNPSPVAAVEEPAKEPPMFEIRRAELGNDHLGRPWAVECVRELGYDDWEATFHIDGAMHAVMDIGRLKCGHSPDVRLEVWSERATYVVLTHISTWGTGVWGSSEYWYALHRLEDHEQHVLHVQVTGHLNGWGLVFNRELSANSCRALGSEVAVQVASRLDVLSGDTTLFEVFRHMTYRWDESSQRFVPEDDNADRTIRGMWLFGEDELVTHCLPELTDWFSSPRQDPEFLRELLVEVETAEARNALENLLVSRD